MSKQAITIVVCRSPTCAFLLTSHYSSAPELSFSLSLQDHS